MKDEIRVDFLIDEEGAGEARSQYLKGHTDEAKAIYEKEMVRRERKAAKAEEAEEVPSEDEGE